MLVQFSQDKQFVVFSHEDINEYKRLYEFPAFIKKGPYFCCPAKINVVHNLVNRMKATKMKIKVQQEVLDFINQPFKLLPIPAEFKYYTSPMNYQEISLRYMLTVGSGGLLLDPGMGKSKVVLDYIALKQFKKSIIICPMALLFVWEDEIRIHRPDLTFHTIRTTEFENEKEGILKADVTICNYSKAVICREELQHIEYQFIHLDEFLIKDPKTARTKEITKLASTIPFRCGGSGTLINNTIEDVFCPTRYLEPSLVGGNFSNFRNKHAVFQVVKNKEGTERNQIVAFKGRDEARSILESCCIVMSKEQWLTLPSKKFIDIHVSMSQEQKDAYFSLMRNYLTWVKGEEIEVDNPLVMMSKLYQISNGFVYITPPEEIDQELLDLTAEEVKKPKKKTKRKTIFFDDCGKIHALNKLIGSEGSIKDRRGILWFNMEAELTLIKDYLEKANIPFEVIRGGEKDTGGKVRRFNNDPGIKWLVCQAKSVNYGITVLGTNLEKLEQEDYPVFPGISPEVYTQIFYSMNFSLEVFLQQQDRIHRLGQKHDCEYYRLFSTSPVEKRIREAIEDKMSLRKEMLVDVATTLLKDSLESQEPDVPLV